MTDTPAADQAYRHRLIFNHLAQEWPGLFGQGIPRDYVCLDCEGSGFSRQHDFVTEIGHCVVRDGKPIDRYAVVLDWTRGDYFDLSYVEERMRRLSESMAQQGKTNHMSTNRMRKEGIDPAKACEFYGQFLETVASGNLLVVAHNMTYDEEMLSSTFQRVGQPEFGFNADCVLDTGAIAKICQVPHAVGVARIPGELLADYFYRTAKRIQPGIKWGLDTYCVPFYKLGRFLTEEEQALEHSARHDAYLCHLLVEEYRKECGCLRRRQL